MAIYVYDKKTGAKKPWAGAEDDASLEKLGLSRTPIQQAVANSTPQATQQPTGGYESPYSSDIAKALRSISNMGSFSYDPSSDEGLQAAQDEAISGVSRGAARRNMLYSDSNKSQMGKAALALVPQFEQNAFNRYQGQLGNLFNQLSTLTGLENQNYGRYRDTVNDQRADQQNQLTNAYNMAQLTGQYIPGFTGQLDPSLNQYSNDFMAEINRRAATPDTSDDALIPQLQALRNLKIQSDPDLMNQYGGTLAGMQTMQSQQLQQSKAESDRGFEESVRQFNVGQQNWQKEFTFKEMQQKIENALAQKRISIDQAQLALQQARFVADQDANSLDNKIKQAQLEVYNQGGMTDADMRSKAAQLATDNYGQFNYETYQQIYDALKGIVSSTTTSNSTPQQSNDSWMYNK